MNRLYKITRTPDGVEVQVIHDCGWYPLPPRNEIFNHSPNGFEFGYSGSGPAQLALALCVDALTTDGVSDIGRALSVHQEFKDLYIAPIEGNEHSFTRDEVRHRIELIERHRAALAKAARS